MTEDMSGVRIDKALGSLPEIGSRSRAESLITSELVFVNDKVASSSLKLKLNQKVVVNFPEPTTSDLKALALKLDIIFEDEDLLVINKPAGLVVHPAAGHAEDTLVNALIHQVPNLSMGFGEERPGIVHRLDKDTSGLLVVAKNDKTHEALAAQFKEKTTHRIYEALVVGRPFPQIGKIQSYLARHPTDRKRYASCLGADRKIIRHFGVATPGKWAVTHYEVLQTLTESKKNPAVSKIRLRLETGRTHQIRVHLSELGWPIVADPIYNKKPRPLDFLDFPRLALHAGELGFVHPRTGESMMFKQAWPSPEAELIEQFFPLNLIP